MIQTGSLYYAPVFAWSKKNAKDWQFHCLNTGECEDFKNSEEAIIALNAAGWTMCGVDSKNNITTYWFTRTIPSKE